MELNQVIIKILERLAKVENDIKWIKHIGWFLIAQGTVLCGGLIKLLMR